MSSYPLCCVLLALLFSNVIQVQGQKYCGEPSLDWFHFSGNCYRLFSAGKTFAEAQHLCEVEGGNLTSILNALENEFILELTQSGSTFPIWIGFTDIDAEGRFQWIDGQKSHYTAWADSEPNNAASSTNLNPTGEEDCTELLRNNGKWNDVDCNFQKKFMCKKEHKPKYLDCPSDITTRLTSTSPNAEVHWRPPVALNASGLLIVKEPYFEPGDLFPIGTTYINYTFTDLADNTTEICMFTVNVVNCPQPWEFFDGNCYYVSEMVTNFEDAITACLSAGGSLTNILGPDENEFIAEQMVLRDVNEAWIGLKFAYEHTSKYSYRFEWLDGNRLQWSKWRPSEPNNNGNTYDTLQERASMESTEDCVEIQVDTLPIGWNDVKCGLEKNFICKKAPVEELFEYCPQSLVVNIELGLETEKSVFWIEPYATRFLPLKYDRSHNPGATFAVGVTTVTYGLFFIDTFFVMNCSFDVTIQTVDTKPPVVLSCPDNIVPIAEPGVTAIPVYWTPPEVFDYSNVTVTESRPPGEMYYLGVTRYISYTFTDSSGNMADCRFWVKPIQGYKYVASDGRCARDSWRIHNGFCYHVSDCRKDYEEASSSCEAMSATLTSIRDESENEFLTGLLRQKIGSDSGAAWIGLNDISLEGLYRWVDGSEMSNVSYTNYNQGEPNDGGDYTAPEDCIELIGFDSAPGLWNDVHCDTHNYYICKKSLNKPIQCPQSFETIAEQGMREKVVYWEEPENITVDSRNFHAKGSHFPGDTFPVGLTWLNYTLQDSKGMYSDCTFSITVLFFDTTPPLIEECPSNIIHRVERGTPTTAVHWSTPSATDESGVVFMNQTHAPGDEFTAGSHEVMYMFIDEYKNIAVCQFQVTIIEVKTQPPKLKNCPPASIIKGKVESGRIRIHWFDIRAEDPFGNVTLLAKTHSPGDLFPQGSTMVSYFFVDSFLNIATCNFTLIVRVDDLTLNSDTKDADSKEDASSKQQEASSSIMVGLIIPLVILIILLIVLIIIVIHFYRKSKRVNDMEYLSMDGSIKK